MAEAICGTCSGRGGAYVAEIDASGRPTGGEVWQPCETCGGTGVVWAPDEELAPQPQARPRRQRSQEQRPARLTPERLDRSFRTLLTLAFACLLGWLCLATPILREANPWVLLGVCVVLVGLFYWGLTLIPGVIRILRIGFAWFLVLGLALAFAVGAYLAVS